MELDRETAVAEMLAAARELLEDESRFVELARAIGRLSRVIDPEFQDPELTGFVAIDSESDGLAIGNVLNEWSPEMRPIKQRELERFVTTYRADALRDAARLIERYGAA